MADTRRNGRGATSEGRRHGRKPRAKNDPTAYKGEVVDRDEAARRMTAAREARGLSKAKAARMTGLKPARVAEIERGKVMSWTRMIWYVRTLGLDPRVVAPELFAAEPPPPAERPVEPPARARAPRPKAAPPVRVVNYEPGTPAEDEPHPFVMEQGVHGGSAWAKVCSRRTEAAALNLLREAEPTFEDHGWFWVKTYQNFADGSPNPCPCPESPETHRHYLFNTAKKEPSVVDPISDPEPEPAPSV